MKIKLLILSILYSTLAFSESTIFLFNGNSPYSDPSKDFFDDLYKGVHGLNGIGNKVVFFPEQYEMSLDYLVDLEVTKMTLEATADSLNSSLFDSVGQDNGWINGGINLGGGLGGDFGLNLDLGFDLPELTEEEKQRIDAKNNLDYLFNMKHDAFASKDLLASKVDQYITEENSRGGGFEGDVTFYFTDHGSLREDKTTKNKVHSFGAGEGDLYVEDMVTYHREVHNSFPDKKVIFIHDHCFSGGMLKSLWKNEESLEIHPNVCGFAAASPSQPSYMGETFMDMLSQISNFTDPEKIAAVDKDGDGNYSYGEGMDYYQSVLHSGEVVGRAIPYSTKDTFLNAVYDKINSDSPDVKRNMGGDKCLSEAAAEKIDVSSINGAVYKILAEGHVAKSEKALEEYLSFLGIKDSPNVLNDLNTMLGIDELKLQLNEAELAKLQDEYIEEKMKVIGYIADFYDIPDYEGFYLGLNKMLDVYIMTDPKHFYEKIDAVVREHYCIPKEGSSGPSLEGFSKAFSPYIEKYNKHHALETDVDNFSTQTTKYQRVLKEYKNLEGLKGIVSAIDSKDPAEAQWGRERFADYLSILECENSPFAEVKSVQKN